MSGVFFIFFPLQRARGAREIEEESERESMIVYYFDWCSCFVFVPCKMKTKPKGTNTVGNNGTERKCKEKKTSERNKNSKI